MAAVSPLFEAIFNKNYPRVKQLLQEGSSPHQIEDKRCMTPMHYAAFTNDLELAKILVEHDDHLKDSKNIEQSPLYHATNHQNKEMVEFLLSIGANVNLSGDGWTPLRAACINGNAELAEILLSAGARVNSANNESPPLYLAALNGHEKVMKLLIDAGAYLNSTGMPWTDTPVVFESNGMTPLHGAAMRGQLGAAKMLLEARADINFDSKHNGTPLYTALIHSKNDVAEFLIESGARVNAVWYAPLNLIAGRGDVEMARVLVDAGADVNQRLDDSTPLVSATFNKRTEMVKFLLEVGADPNPSTVHNPLKIALDKEFMEIAEILRAAGAK